MKQFQGTRRPRSMMLFAFALGSLGVTLARATPAQARGAGLATSCDSCHRGGQIPRVTITMSPPVIQPGETTTVTVEIAAVNGGFAGFYLHARGQGVFQDVPGAGTRLPTTSEVVHATPKSGNGTISFQARWTAPTKPGSFGFEAWGVSANGNKVPTEDGARAVTHSFTVGCQGLTVYGDFDGDGFGSDANGPSQACELLAGYVLKGGDCNDFRATVYTGAPEICDEHDNDCDGQVNEGLENATVYRDADGDGYGDRFSTDMRVGCAQSGYSTLRTDCNDKDEDIHPGAKEICNNQDDNCNNRIDEGARLTCGTGWCRSVADTCVATYCTPNTPRAEQCNLIDDDCDGVIDNDAPCDPGRVCVTGRCLKDDDARAIMEAQQHDGGVADGGGGGGSGGGTKPVGAKDAGAGGGAGTARQRERPGCQFGAGTPAAAGGWWLLGLGVAAAVRAARRRR